MLGSHGVPVSYVTDVQRHHLAGREPIPARDLPKTADAWPDHLAHEVPERVRRAVLRHHRSRPDYAPLALQHVEKLRQLIQARAPQVSADAGHARVELGLVTALRRAFVEPVLRRLDVKRLAAPVAHRPHLPDGERLPQLADPLVT